MNKVNIEEHRGFIHYLINKIGTPMKEREDVYQEFCVYYYSAKRNYNPEYKVTTLLEMVFRHFLQHKITRENIDKRKELDLVYMDAFEDFENFEIEHTSYTPSMEKMVDIARMCKRLPDLFKELIVGSTTYEIVAKKEGVTRQAIENRLKKDMYNIRYNGRGFYGC